MAKRKSRVQQQAIAEETTEQQQRLKLTRQIALMKRLPKDFRDITLGTDWEAFADITGRRKEMDAWYYGPVLYLAPLNESEKMILGSPNKLVPYWASGLKVELSPENWIGIIKHAEDIDCSWIYLPDEETLVIEAFNTLFSRFGSKLRAKGRLMSAMTGKPVGVVH